MGSLDTTILSWPNALIFPAIRLAGNSSTTASICMVLCSPESCVRAIYALVVSVLGPVDGPSPDLWYFQRMLFLRAVEGFPADPGPSSVGPHALLQLPPRVPRWNCRSGTQS
jgi:hypothetical protein